MSLYPQCGTPKLHYTWHSLLSWQLFQVLITTLGAESEHKDPKRLMAHCYNQCCKTSMAHWLRDFMQTVRDPDTFAPTFLRDRRICNMNIPLPMGLLRVVFASREISTPHGTFHKGDFVHWVAEGIQGGVAKSFAMVQFNGAIDFLAEVQQYSHIAAGFWTPAQHIVLNADDLRGAVPFVKGGQWVRPLLPHCNDV